MLRAGHEIKLSERSLRAALYDPEYGIVLSRDRLSSICGIRDYAGGSNVIDGYPLSA
ncbi:MAG: hypothetical protein ACLTMH_09715 [Faecalimonas umbilicata]|uniref:hypothetical protein n=1 Tax=Faecalimonas umbilicata TaxID=1912855 RepID=UPI00399629E8